MLRVEIYSTPALLSARRTGAETGDLWFTLIHRLPGANRALFSDTASLVRTGMTPKRGESLWNISASSGSQLDIVMPVFFIRFKFAV
jgi:outer membrane protein assembly factor BamA